MRIITILRSQNLLWTLAVHDFRSQYLDSMLGFLWSWIKPLVMAGIYVYIFSSVTSSADPVTGNPVHFGLYVFAGMLPWFTVQESLQRATTVLIDYSHLVRHHTLPLYILPFHIVLSATGSGIMAVIVFLLVKSVISGLPDFHSLLLIAFLPLQILFCSGLSLLLCTATVFVRDISHLTISLLTIWFFASPIVFPLHSLPWILKEPWSNPLVSLTQIYRDLLLFHTLPDLNIVLIFTAFALLSIMVGTYFYLKTHREIVDWV